MWTSMKRLRLARPAAFRLLGFSLFIPLLYLPNGCRKHSTTISAISRSPGTLLWEPLREGVGEVISGTELTMQSNSSPDEDDIESQLGLLEEAIAGRARGIIFAPDETLASRNSILDAVNRHIPVVIVDDELGPPAGPFLSYVSNDEQFGVQLAAQRLAKQLHGHGSVDVVGINARRESSVTREGLFEEALSQVAPEIKITLRQFGDASITHQQQICRDILTGTSPPDAIVALSAAATRGAYYAKIASEHHSATILIGFDQDVMLPVQTGDVDAVVIQDTRTIGRRSMQNIMAQLQGESVPAETMVQPLLVTRDNLGSPPVASILRLSRFANDAQSDSKFEQFDGRSGEDAGSFLEEAKKHGLQPGVQPIGSFIRVPGKHPKAAVQGSIISLHPTLGVQDTTSSLFVTSFTTADPLKLGDVVEVRGDLISERFRSHMENASIKVLWSERPIPPLAVTATQLTEAYRGESIEVEGNVLAERMDSGRPELILRDGAQTFRALVYGPPNVKSERFPAGSRVRLHGVAFSGTQLTNGIYPFTVVADKVGLLSPPPWWSPLHITEVVFAAIALLLGIQWLLHSVQRWHLRSVLQEREQLAFEMHDTLAQSFTGIAYQLQAARAEKGGENAIQTHIANALQMVAMSHREASHTIASLRPQHRDAPGILAALKQLAERLSAGGGISVHTAINDRPAELPIEVTEAFFRIGQEAISNAIRHGHCRTLSIELRISRRAAILGVQDDGVGFSPCLPSSGLGIKGMKKRSDKIRAKFAVTSAPGSGTTVTVSCPLVFPRGLFHGLRAVLTRHSQTRSAN